MKDTGKEKRFTINGVASALLILGPLLTIALGVYALSLMLGDQWQGPVIGIGILFVLPACLSAIVTMVMTPYRARKNFRAIVALVSVLTVLALGGVLVGESIICIVLLLPLWLIGILVGILTAENLQSKRVEQDKMKVSILALLPFVVLFADIWVPRPTSHYTVARTIIIDAPTHEVWQHLLHMNNIDVLEGKWTFSQNMLGIPRPRSALVKGTTLEAVRYARWGEHIRFEENITAWTDESRLHWEFAFPDSSISDYTDSHISPKGHYLDIHDGGYRLEDIEGRKTKLVLETNYIVSTPINLYGKIWGEIILGDLQNNILHIVRARAESVNNSL